MFDAAKAQTQRAARRRLCPQCDKVDCKGDSCVRVPDYIDAEASCSGRKARQHNHGSREGVLQCREPESRLHFTPAKRDPIRSRDTRRSITKLEKLRNEFLSANMERLKEMIPGLVALHATDLSHGAVKSFLIAMKKPCARMVLAFHGTKERNIDSICSRGLLLQGSKGMPHRHCCRGIYTAAHFQTSQYYCDSNKMFVCAVVEYFEGRKHCIKGGERCEVVHGDGVMIVHNESRVLPLFLMEWKDPDPETHGEAKTADKMERIRHQMSKVKEKEDIMAKRRKQSKVRTKQRNHLRISKLEP